MSAQLRVGTAQLPSMLEQRPARPIDALRSPGQADFAPGIRGIDGHADGARGRGGVGRQDGDTESASDVAADRGDVLRLQDDPGREGRRSAEGVSPPAGMETPIQGEERLIPNLLERNRPAAGKLVNDRKNERERLPPSGNQLVGSRRQAP